MSTIKFGTDGWRAVIGEEFIPENVAKVAQAYANIYHRLEAAKAPVIIGYDRRAKSKESAQLIAEILTANNIPVSLSNSYCPTPAVSWMVKHKRAAAGIMITASHNPPKWNGIKFKESYGGSASIEFTTPIEQEIKHGVHIKRGSLENNELLSYFDPKIEYIEQLKSLVDLNKIKSARFKCLIDPMYGSGVGYFPLIIGEMATEIHTEHDTNFGGIHPEPIIPHVNEAIEIMKCGNYSACLINDGDADRIGAIDEKGNYITSHLLFSILLKHVVENKGWKGSVIKSISTTRMINRLCKKYGIELATTPVGFKHISPALNKGGVLVGGEESGGIGFPIHICERDGILCGLLILETMATCSKKLGKLVDEIQSEVGPCFYKRNDLRLTPQKMEEAKSILEKSNIKEIAGKIVKEHTTIDGHHFLLDDESWLLVRSSGTEPLMRIYAEAPSMGRVEEMLNHAKAILKLD